MTDRRGNMTPNPELDKSDKHICPLARLKKGECAIVVGLSEINGDEQHAICRRLQELGFAPGEQVRVVAESFPRKDPMAVRIGNTMFALRRHEAALVQVTHASA